MQWGTVRNIVRNLVEGVNQGFTINLEISGVGYKAAMQGNDLVMQLGFSHEVRYKIPQGIAVKCEKPTAISVHGADRQLVGQVAAEIRGYKKPEPYKGKGIMYQNEKIIRKEGKKK
jgi:large subunit ribosomal protein L6